MIQGPISSPTELGKFLRAKRESLSPELLNIKINNRRRVKGLRRSEVAMLAGVGIDWYIALEQGRDVRPSEYVLSLLANALLLDPAESDHLYALAGRSPTIRNSYDITEVSQVILQTIEKLNPYPAYILDISWDVLASNDAAKQLWGFSDSAPNNLLWITFITHSNPEDNHWIWLTDYFLRSFRRQAALYPEHPRILDLISKLKHESQRFCELWKNTEVRDTKGGTKTLIHPVNGAKTYNFSALAIPEIPGAYLFIYIDT